MSSILWVNVKLHSIQLRPRFAHVANFCTKFVPLRSIPTQELGQSILIKNDSSFSMKKVRQGNLLTPRMVFAAKVLSLSSSMLGIAMIPFMSRLATHKPGAGMLVAVLDSFFIAYAFTPLLLHQILVKRYVVDVYYNSETETFTSVHYSFFLGKKALRFQASDVVDSDHSPEMFKLWFPLATVVIHGKPLMLPVEKESYAFGDIYEKLATRLTARNV